MINEYQLNEVVIEVFKKSGMNQREFSQEYELSYSSLNHILTKENVCSFRFLQKLSKNMGKKLTIKLE